MKDFHNEKMETAARAEIEELQPKGFERSVDHVYRSNPIYRKLFDTRGVRPEDIRGLADITKLPMTNKNILRESYPLGLSCVPRSSIAEMHMSSGSTGTPVVMPYTPADLAQWAECMARCYRMAGRRARRRGADHALLRAVQRRLRLLPRGARARGCSSIPTGAGNTPRQIRAGEGLQDPHPHRRGLLRHPHHGGAGGAEGGAARPAQSASSAPSPSPTR